MLVVCLKVSDRFPSILVMVFIIIFFLISNMNVLIYSSGMLSSEKRNISCWQ